MSVQAALKFINVLRSNPDVHYVKELTDELTGFSELLRLAEQHGENFSEAEFRRAFAIDWSMRFRARSGVKT